MTDTVVLIDTHALDPATTARVLLLFDKGALTDERLVQLYKRNAHFWVSWTNYPARTIIRHRERLSSDLLLTTVIDRGEVKFAKTEHLAGAR